ncbi:MAG: nickel pincer cofactor biosynthesis protein LarB [candidate division Zixibacteria bacterium]|nr:nickel pincer cofactor biosynthesis protein LarB [candidate division Zixibacteria bacterium]
MDIRSILDDVAAGRLSASDAHQKLSDWPAADLGFARIDNHRESRTGFVEVVYCGGKTPEQVAGILERQWTTHKTLLATRAETAHAEAAQRVVGDLEYHAVPKVLRRLDSSRTHDVPPIAVVSAGTSDLPISEEAALTVETVGHPMQRFYDVGVAGLHRVASVRNQLEECGAVIVVAGMDGALPSVVGGLISRPVIAVPTSIGYGASFNGLAALLGMLSSCAPGVTVVNIDNGFGAAIAACRINQARVPQKLSGS